MQENIYDRFLEAFLAFTQKTSVIGHPFEETTTHGPQVSKAQYERILSYVKIAEEEGAKVLVGGNSQPLNGKGYFIQPTVIGDVKPSMRVFQEEIFGPVVVFSKFKSIEEAVQFANETQYGLGSAVFTRDISNAIRVSEDLQAGMVWVNSSNNSDFRVPFGGVKQSGIGRELGEAALASYSVAKAVHVNLIMADY